MILILCNSSSFKLEMFLSFYFKIFSSVSIFVVNVYKSIYKFSIYFPFSSLSLSDKLF